MNISKLRLFFISQSLAFTYFWIAISIPYLIYRNLSPVQALSLMSFYQFFGVILEYPTGVIGDRYGYRRVTYIANILNFLSMILMSFQGNYYYYLFVLFVLALGNGFSSGNDMGILKSISINIKKDTANYNALMGIVLFFSAVIGGLISRISYEYALIISGVCMLLANFPLYLLKDGIIQYKTTESITVIVKDGFHALKNSTLKQIFVVLALFGGYFFSVKSIFGSFGSIYHIDVATIGIIIGLQSLAPAIGHKLYAEFPKIGVFIVAILVCASFILMGIFPLYPIIITVMLMHQLIIGYMISKIDGDIHEQASDHIRASLFSLKRLVMRLVSSSYLLVYGIAIGAGQFALAMYGFGCILLFGAILARKYLNAKMR